MIGKLRVKRVYDAPAKADGLRVLVDGMWPRGLSKQNADVDYWAKDIAPSTELRRWFAHDRDKWREFSRHYQAELSKNEAEVDDLRRQIGSKTATLLFAARDKEHNNAVVLRDFLAAGN